MNRKGKIYSIVLALMLAVVLCGCGVKEKSEAEIKADLSADLSVLNTRTDVVLQDFSITKRQTDQDTKVDAVFVDFSILTDDGVAEGKGSCVMTYIMYNDGWMLENVETEHIEYIPLKGMELSEEELKNSMSAQYGANAISTEFELTGRTTQLELGTDVYTASMKNVYKYMTEYLEVSLGFAFDTTGGFWYQNHMGKNSSKEEWDIEGTYSVSGVDNRKVILTNELVQRDIDGCSIGRLDYWNEWDYDKADYVYELSRFSNSVFWGSELGKDSPNSNYEYYIVMNRFQVEFDYYKYNFCLRDGQEMVFIGKNDILYFNTYTRGTYIEKFDNIEIDEYRRVATVIGKTMSRVK